MNDVTIYLVVGSTGVYDDHKEWEVIAYPKKEDAEAHAKAAKSFVPQYTQKYGVVNPYDPDMEVDWNGTVYNVREIILRESFYQKIS